MNTTENNKIIAEFMGRVIPEDKLEFYDENPTTHYYHSNWNWLMEVVEKIYTLDLYYDKYIDFNSSLIDSGKIKLSTNINHVYNACVEFIKWYNENK